MTRTIETISLITVMITVLFMNQHLALSESNNDKDYLMNSTAIRQLNSPVYMFEFEGEKYVFTSGWYLNHYGSHYINCLTLLENGENVYRFDNSIRIVGYCDGRIYYVLSGSPAELKKLKFFDLRSMQSKQILCEYAVEAGFASIYYPCDIIFIPLKKNDDGFRYAVVSGERVIRYETNVAVLQHQNRRYSMIMPDPMIYTSNLFTTEYVKETDEHGHDQVLNLGIRGGTTAVSVFESNGNCFIYCDQGTDVLYVIDSDHHLFPIFSCGECIMSETALAIHDTCICLSIKRYEKLGQNALGYSRFDNDEVEGTYMINTNDLSVKKVSDFIFSGLFNLDDTCLYGCDSQGDIYRIDFSGDYEMVFSQINGTI